MGRWLTISRSRVVVENAAVANDVSPRMNPRLRCMLSLYFSSGGRTAECADVIRSKWRGGNVDPAEHQPCFVIRWFGRLT